MPVECGVAFDLVRQERFHAVDRVVMSHVFNMHNTMGRFFDENIYQEELARRCGASGLAAQREVEIRISHQHFVKPYFLDLLVESGIIYELKTMDRLHSSHESQLIHYLLLAGLSHGKLVNFRPGSIQSRFVSTTLDRRNRATFRVTYDCWDGADAVSRGLRETLLAILDDWGTFLNGNLYKEALLFLIEGPCVGIGPVDITVAGRVVGSQKLSLLDEKTAWHLSTVRRGMQSYETHVKRLLSHTQLKRIHWINLNHHNILLKTLTK